VGDEFDFMVYFSGLWQYIFAANATLSHKIFVGLKLSADSGRNYDIAIH